MRLRHLKRFGPGFGLPFNAVSVAFLLFCGATLSSGCATLGDSKQYVSVDSEPRGQAVSLTEDASGYVGRTPLFLSLPPSTSAELYQLREGSRSRALKVKCRFAWESVLLGNLPLAVALGPAFGGIFLGASVAVDLWTESAFLCPARINFSERSLRLRVESAQNQDRRKCRRVLIVPPYQFKKREADRLLLTWVQAMRPRLPQCDELLFGKHVDEHLARLDVTFDKPLPASGLEQRQLSRLGIQTGATHYVVMKLRRSSRGAEVISQMRDMHGEKKRKLPVLPVPSFNRSPTLSGVLTFFDQSFWFLPNTLQFASLWMWPNFSQENADYRFFRHDDGRDYLSLLGGWELSYVPRQDLRRRYSVSFESSFSLWSNLAQRDMSMYWKFSNVDPDDGIFEFRDVMNILYLGFTSENRVYWMTPYLSPFVGAGGGLVRVDTFFRGESTGGFSPFLQGYGGLIGQSGDNTFLELSGGFATTAEPHVENKYTELMDFFFLRAKAGFYFPVLRQAVREYF